MISFACYHIYNLNKMKIVWIELEQSIIKSEQSYSELSVKEVEEYNVDTLICEKLSKMIDYIYELKGKKGVNWRPKVLKKVNRNKGNQKVKNKSDEIKVDTKDQRKRLLENPLFCEYHSLFKVSFDLNDTKETPNGNSEARQEQ